MTRDAPLVEVELAQVDAVDLDAALLRVVQAAQQLGERGLARAVHADDRHRRARGDREVEAARARAGDRAGTRTSTSRKRISRAGIAGRGRRRRRRPGARPPRPSRGSSRLSATTGAAAPSSAQLQPPNAIIDVPTSAVRNTIVRSRLMRPSPAAFGDRPRDEHVGGEHDHHAATRAGARAAASTSTGARRGGGGAT